MVRLGASSADKGVGYASSVLENNALRDAHSNDITLHTQWLHTTDAGEEWQLNVYRNQERVNEHWNAVAPDGTLVPLNRDRDAVRDHIEVQHRSTPGRLYAIGVGRAKPGGIRSTRPFCLRARTPDPTVMTRAFSNVEWRFAKGWSTNLGAALERYTHNPTHFAPRAFINWQATENATWRVGGARAWQQDPTFARYGDVRAYRPGTSEVLVQPYVPNPDLLQERIDSVEAGFFGNWKKAGVTLDVRVFRERIKNYIYRELTPSPYSPTLSNIIAVVHDYIRVRGLSRDDGGWSIRSRRALGRGASCVSRTPLLIAIPAGRISTTVLRLT